MSDEFHKEMFDVRSINVVKLTSVVDCEIMLRECDHTLGEIDRQLSAPGFGDRVWREDAVAARVGVIHKRALVEMKLGSIKEKMAKPPVPPEDNFKSRFMKAAEALLPVETYEAIREAARFKEAA